MSLIDGCIRDMESHGIHQWNEYYPTREIFQSDIKSGSLYEIREKDEILGIVTINEVQPPEYKGIGWSIQEGRIMAIHRLAVNPKWHRKGIAGKLLDQAEKLATDKGYASIRLDAYSGNPRALGLYEKRGYRRVGQLHFPRRELPFYCYEKIMI